MSPKEPAFSMVHFSSRTDEWPTPMFLFRALDAEFKFTLDPCATAENTKCPRFFTRADDGLKQDWNGYRVFMNPPYGRTIGAWVEKAYRTSLQGNTVVCLLPARCDTSWWHQHVMRARQIRFLRGRLTFEGGLHPAPFPSAIVVFAPDPPAIAGLSSRAGKSGYVDPLAESPNMLVRAE